MTQIANSVILQEQLLVTKTARLFHHLQEGMVFVEMLFLTKAKNVILELTHQTATITANWLCVKMGKLNQDLKAANLLTQLAVIISAN